MRRFAMAVAAATLATIRLAGAPAAAQEEAQENSMPEPQIQVELLPTEITAGDRVTATLRLIWPAGAPDTDARFPAWQDTWGDAEILGTSSVARERSSGGDLVFTQTVELTAFEVGETKLPAMQLALPLGEQTLEVDTPDDLVLVVRSVLPETEEEPALLPPAAPERQPLGRPFLWTSGLLGLACLLAFMQVARKKMLQPEFGLPRRPKLPPLDELRVSLSRIDVEKSAKAHTALSLALRAFVGRTTGVPAVERTTTEILRLLRDSHLEPEWSRRLVTLLRRCDEAKFVPRIEVDVATTAERVREAEAVAVALDDDLRRRREAQIEAAQLEAARAEAAPQSARLASGSASPASSLPASRHAASSTSVSSAATHAEPDSRGPVTRAPMAQARANQAEAGRRRTRGLR